MAYLGEKIPKLGFGFMRLPMLQGEIDIEQTKQMVDLFLAKGFTYFDTAFGYANGKSEEALKTALVDRYPREVPDSNQAACLDGCKREGSQGDVSHLYEAARYGLYRFLPSAQCRSKQKSEL
jgi:hypothetical protein